MSGSVAHVMILNDFLCTVSPLHAHRRRECRESDPPTLDRVRHSAELCDFVTATLTQDPDARPAAEVLTEHTSLQVRDETADSDELRAWIHSCLAHDNADADQSGA